MPPKNSFLPQDGQYRAQQIWFEAPEYGKHDEAFASVEEAADNANTLSIDNQHWFVCLIFDGDGTEHLRDADPVLRAVVYGGKVYQIATPPINLTDFQRDQLRRVQEGGE